MMESKATLHQIICDVRDGKRPDYEDLRYAICALEALTTFDEMAFEKLAEAEQELKRPFLTTSAVWQYEESLDRHRRARAVHPKTYVGWNNDPDNPEFLKRRQAAIELVERLAAKGQSHASTT